MAAAIGLRVDYDARRLLALAPIYDGGARSEAAKIGGVTLQVVRDWVLRFNAGGPDGLVDRKAPGQPSRLDAAHRAALAALIEEGPTPAIHGVDHCCAAWNKLVDLPWRIMSIGLRDWTHGL